MPTNRQTSQTTAPDTPEASSNSTLSWLIILTAIVLLAVGCRDMDFTCDSAHYIDAARMLIEEHTYATKYLTLQAPQVPSALSYWPPLYSAALAVPLALGLSQNAAAWVVAVLGYGLGLYLLVYWLKRPEWVLLGTVCYIYIIFNSGLAFRALSEAVYIPLMIGALVFSAQAVGRNTAGSQRKAAIAAGVMSGLAILGRYIGFVLVPAMGLMTVGAVMMNEDRQQRKRQLLNAGLILAIAICMAGLWLLRSYWMTGRFFGPERPPGVYSTHTVLLGFATPFYRRFFPFLISFLFAAVGFHRLRRTDGDARSTTSWVLIIGSIGYAVIVIFGTVGSHLIFQFDQPAEARQLVPAYMGLTLAALALIRQMEPPSDVLRRRWYIVVPLALPILIAPVVAGIASNPMQPRITEIDRWVQSQTGPDDLLIGQRVWPVRFNTGRPVLHKTFVAAPSVYEGQKVAPFLGRFGDEFNDFYLLVPKEDHSSEIRTSYRRAGLETEQIATVTTKPHHPQETGQMQMVIYRVSFAPPERNSIAPMGAGPFILSTAFNPGPSELITQPVPAKRLFMRQRN